MIQERINTLKEEIEVRQKELKSLSNKLMSEATDTLSKFKIWANNGLDKKTESSIPDKELRAWTDEHLDLGSQRGMVNLFDLEEEFGLFLDGMDEEYPEAVEKLRNDKLFLGACEYMMRNNMDSFEIDW